MRTTIALLLTIALVGCEDPTETPPLEAAYLLDRVNGRALPAPICEDDAVDQLMQFESVALDEDGSYGRFQQVRIGPDQVVEQEERGEYVRTDSSFLLINAAEDTLVLTLLDEQALRLRRIHPCGDTLRYSEARVDG